MRSTTQQSNGFEMAAFSSAQREVLLSATRLLVMTRLGESETATAEVEIERRLLSALSDAAAPLVGIGADPLLLPRHSGCLYESQSDRSAPTARGSTEGRCTQCMTTACGPTRCP